MNFSLRTDGVLFVDHTLTPRMSAITRVEAALRARRAARAAYGRALLEADYTRPLEERQAAYDALRAAVMSAQAKLDQALDALEEQA